MLRLVSVLDHVGRILLVEHFVVFAVQNVPVLCNYIQYWCPLRVFPRLVLPDIERSHSLVESFGSMLE